jgi:hypothetical protein
MNLIKKVLGKFSGLKYPQEYLCLAKESFEQPLHVYLITGGQIIEDITNSHNFVGYSPVIFTLFSSQTIPGMITVAFSERPLQPNEKFSKKDAVAILDMKKINEQAIDNGTVFYFEGTNGRHHFLSSFHQFIIQLQNKFYQKKTGNVFLPGNLYKQVQIAYSIPRTISLITVNNGRCYNLFPTDLHGPVGEKHYIVSLRHEGKACAQVLEAGKILLSEMDSSIYKTVYHLGKNHMQPLKEKEKFRLFSDQVSDALQLPLPHYTVFFRELELIDFFTHGIHQLMLFKVANWQPLQPQTSILAHIHTVYASWRHNNRLKGNYLMR